MGGTIRVESKVGTGSTFFFTVQLPLSEEVPADKEQPSLVAAAAEQPLRILLAEDNPANQKLATYILQERGHVVDVVGGGAEAIDLAQRHAYDAILMDVQMPGMNGLEDHGGDPPATIGRPPRAHYRHDGPRPEKRPRALPGGGYGCVSVETGQCAGTGRDHRGSVETVGRSRRRSALRRRLRPIAAARP